MIFPILMIIGCISCKNNQEHQFQNSNNGKTDNRKIVKKNNLAYSIDAYLNSKDEGEIDSLVTENYLRNMNGIPVVTNKTELKARLNLYTVGFPDYNISMGNSKVCENQGYVDWIFTGTNTGQFAELMPTGKKVKIKGFSHLYFNGEGHIYREDIYYNELEFLQQLGYSLEAPIVK